MENRFMECQIENGGGISGTVRDNTHLYCLAVQAGFYSDVLECWLRMLEIPGSIPRWGKRCLAFFHLIHLPPNVK